MRLKLNPLTTSGVSVVEPVTVIAGSGGSSTSSTGVSSLAKSGDTALTGAVTLSGGSNVTLTQTGQNIEIAASGSTGVASVVAGGNIDVDATDPANPIVSVETLTLADISDVTASASEVNILDGATLTTTELNYVDGVTSAIQTQLDGKVDENGAIVGATKTKITYDAKGLVTAGADATTADIADSTNKRYVTDAQLTVIGNTSGTNTGDVTVSDSSEIDLTLTGQQISASIVAGSIDETKLDTSVNASLDLADTALQSSAIGTTVQAYDADLTTLATAFTSASAIGPASLALAEDTDNGTNKVTLIAPSTMSADRILTLPNITDTLVGKTTTDTFSNKSIDLASNTLTGTTAEFNTALSDNDFATLAGAETLSNKTLTAPKFADLGYIADANGNELIVMDTVASAVPYVRVANAATGGVVSISADGETNQHIAITGKGNGLTKISVLRQADTTDAYKHNTVILTGSGVITQTAVAAIAETVTFGITFAAVPVVILESHGGNFATAATPPAGNRGLDTVSNADAIGTTSFRAVIGTRSGGNFTNAQYAPYSWIAIGEL